VQADAANDLEPAEGVRGPVRRLMPAARSWSILQNLGVEAETGSRPGEFCYLLVMAEPAFRDAGRKQLSAEGFFYWAASRDRRALISGASGAAIAIDLLQQVQLRTGWETHPVVSRGARRTIQMETASSLAEVEARATPCHAIEDVGASPASGTFKAAGMVVALCSMKTVSGIAHEFSEDPIHPGNLPPSANPGVTILPPVLAFSNRPASTKEARVA